MNIVARVSEKTNGGREAIEASLPYTATVTLEGASDMLFHGWNPEAIEAKARQPKNSKAKKTDDVESYVFRLRDGTLAIPGEYLKMSVVNAAKYRQDPRSPRKSAMDLYKAGVVPLTHLAPLGKVSAATLSDWDYLDKRRVMVQRQGVNRTRPAFFAGWRATIDLMVLLPEYIEPNTLREVIEQAGRLIGVADYRPTFGRFGIVGFEVRPG